MFVANVGDINVHYTCAESHCQLLSTHEAGGLVSLGSSGEEEGGDTKPHPAPDARGQQIALHP